MEIKLKPILTALNLQRECPSGRILITGTCSYYTGGGVRAAERGINSYGNSLTVVWDERTIAAAEAFIAAAMVQVEDALSASLETVKP